MHVLILTIEWSYYVHGTNTIMISSCLFHAQGESVYGSSQRFGSPGVHRPDCKVSSPGTQKSEYKFKWKLIESDFVAVDFCSVVYYPAFRMPTCTLRVYISVLLFAEYLHNFKANSRIFMAYVMSLNTFYGFWSPHNCEYFGFSLHLL